MDSRIDTIRGIHPGKLIERDLKKKGITQRSLAEETDIPYQTINAIVTGKRNLTTEQTLKIEKLLDYEEGFLSILQSFYNIKQYKEKEFSNRYAGAPHIRRVLFWDVDFTKINWGKHKNTVIRRVFERGSKEEINEIKRFYNLSTSELRQYKPKKVRPAGLTRKANA